VAQGFSAEPEEIQSPLGRQVSPDVQAEIMQILHSSQRLTPAGPSATPGQPAPVLAPARATQVASLRSATLACAVRGGKGPVFVALPAMAAVKHWLHQQRLHEAAAEPPCPLQTQAAPADGGNGAGAAPQLCTTAVDPVEAWLGQPIRWLL